MPSITPCPSRLSCRTGSHGTGSKWAEARAAPVSIASLTATAACGPSGKPTRQWPRLPQAAAVAAAAAPELAVVDAEAVVEGPLTQAAAEVEELPELACKPLRPAVADDAADASMGASHEACCAAAASWQQPAPQQTNTLSPQPQQQSRQQQQQAQQQQQQQSHGSGAAAGDVVLAGRRFESLLDVRFQMRALQRELLGDAEEVVVPRESPHFELIEVRRACKLPGARKPGMQGQDVRTVCLPGERRVEVRMPRRPMSHVLFFPLFSLLLSQLPGGVQPAPQPCRQGQGRSSLVLCVPQPARAGVRCLANVTPAPSFHCWLSSSSQARCGLRCAV